jgi:cytoskeletal protein CcmA (bactofilin family)
MNEKLSTSPPYSATGAQSSTAKPRALIGSKLRIKGELYGEEDILIQGHVEGTIEVKDNNLTVGADGHVKADSQATQIIVEGEVHGDLSGEEKVVVKATSNVKGNIVAPRVSLEEGARFKGMIDMSQAEPNDNRSAMSEKSKNAKSTDSKESVISKKA